MAKKPTYAELEARIGELEKVVDSSINESQYSELSYRNIIEQLPHEVHIWTLVRDQSGAIKTWKLNYANTAALKTWGKDLAEVVDKTTDEVFPNSNATDLFMPVVEKIFEEGEPLLWEEYFPGTKQILQMVSIPLRENFISAGLDVTDQKNMEAELQLLRKVEAVGKLAGGIAHDFNNQLTPIIGYSDILERSLVDKELLNAVNHIKTAASRCADLTSHLLAFAKKKKAVFENAEIDLLVQETIGLLKHSMDKSITLRYELSTAGVFAKADPSLLQSALLNIALNARDAMPNGGQLSFETSRLTLDSSNCRTLHPSMKEGEYIAVKIRDTGEGMSEEVKAQIFDPFYTTKKNGNGLGLASAYETIQQHGGQIAVSSKVNGGTCFCIYLPTTPSEPMRATKDQTNHDRRSESLNVLVVDDEPLVCELYLDLLSRYNYTVVCKTEPLDAVELYSSEWRKFNIVILDMNMPTMNGLEVFKKMKAVNPDVKAIVCTGYNAIANSADMLELGVHHVLQKPFQSAELLSLIDKILQSQETAAK